MSIIAPGTPAPGVHPQRPRTASEFTRDDLARPDDGPGLLPVRLQPGLHRPAAGLRGGPRRARARRARRMLRRLDRRRRTSQTAFREQLGVDDPAALGLRAQGRDASRAFGAYFEPAGMTNRALVDRRPRRRRAAGRYLADSPGRPARRQPHLRRPPSQRRALACAEQQRHASPRGSRRSPRGRARTKQRACGERRRAAPKPAARSGPCRASASRSRAARLEARGCGARARTGPRTCESTKRCGGSQSWIDVSQRDRHAVQAQPVLDQRADAHRDRRRA